MYQLIIKSDNLDYLSYLIKHELETDYNNSIKSIKIRGMYKKQPE